MPNELNLCQIGAIALLAPGVPSEAMFAHIAKQIACTYCNVKCSIKKKLAIFIVDTQVSVAPKGSSVYAGLRWPPSISQQSVEECALQCGEVSGPTAKVSGSATGAGYGVQGTMSVSPSGFSVGGSGGVVGGSPGVRGNVGVGYTHRY
jgi:hypothetical protein